MVPTVNRFRCCSVKWSLDKSGAVGSDYDLNCWADPVALEFISACFRVCSAEYIYFVTVVQTENFVNPSENRIDGTIVNGEEFCCSRLQTCFVSI